MGTRADRLFIEADRQLEEVREQATSIAARAGIVLSAAGIAATVVGARIQRDVGDYSWALAPLGVARHCCIEPSRVI